MREAGSMIDRPGRVLLISGALGFWVGSVGFPTWAIAVESAQVVAGLVKYPATNPFYIYHTRIWTLVVQLSAALLRAGVSEIALSRLWSGVIGMVSVQALAMFAYAVGGDALLAIGAAFVVLVSRVTDFGVVYPVMLLDTHHTYGALGLSFIVLVMALIGTGCYRSGAFLMGIAPAVHPSLGFWCWIIACLSIAPDAFRLRTELRPAFRYLLLGTLVTVVSLVVQLTLIAHRLPIDRGVAAAYFRAFVGTWDEHRRAVQMSQPGVMLNWEALAVALLMLRVGGRNAPAPRKFLLRTVVVGATLGVVAACFTWLPADRQPVILSTLMPARILNYNVMVLVPLLIGSLAHWRGRLPAQLWLAVVLAALLMNAQGVFAVAFLDPLVILAIAVVGTASVVVLPAFRPRPVVYAASVAIMLVAAAQTLRQIRPASYYLDRTNDPLFATLAAETEGVALGAGSYQLIQLYTRRPVLIDGGGIDTVTYAPDTGPAMRRILRDVYDVDFFNPPVWARGVSMLPHVAVRRVWERFSLQKWQDIRRVYDVTQILTSTEYNLKLPIVAEEGTFRLYRIPETDK
jgi:hypothetical protein